ncbi:MAG: hypothetical protein ACOX4M_03895 [Acetivibrionales bacterium]|jgi:hypothetical protein
MSVVKLPLAKSPIIGLQYIAYSLGITLYDKGSLPWYYSNFIQLFSGDTFNTAMDFYPAWFDTNPWLEYHVFQKEIMKYGNINLHGFIKDCIDHKIYFCSAFDEYYVPCRAFYRNKHYCHDFLIYGYDTARKEYLLMGFNEKRLYKSTRITFAQFEEAFFSGTAMPEYVHLVKRKEGFKYDFNLRLVCELLEDYLYRKNTSERYTNSIRGTVLTGLCWGLDVYKRLRKYFNSLICGNVLYDIRPLHILYEHKKSMVSRLKYMYENNYIDDCSYLYEGYKSLEKETIMLRNLQLKYSATSDKKLLDRIVDTLTKIEKKEEGLLEILIGKVCKKLA